MTLIDAGPLFALLDRREALHTVCVATLPQISTPLITTWPCFTEAMYLADASLIMAADELAQARIFTLDKHFHAY